jgi:prevent-host-death family protein
MDALTYNQVRQNFAETMNKVCEDHTPIIITRQKSPPVVMMSLEDYNAIEETLFLLKSKKNASRLLQSIESIKNNNFVARELIEE